MMARAWGIVGVVALLSACGGGGGGSGSGGGSAPPPAPTVPALSTRCETNSVARLDTEPLRVGASGEIHLLACGSASLSNIRWSGGLLSLSARSPSMSLTPTQAGSPVVSVSFSDNQGRSFSGSLTLEVAANDLPRGVLTRGEPSVWGGGRFSLRAWPQGYSSAELAGSSLRWTQVDGPPLTLSESAGARLIATAPAVTGDSIATLRATLTLANGSTVHDDFRLLVQPPPGATSGALFDSGNPASRVYAYQAAGPWAPQLERCIYNPALLASGANLCVLRELPLLGQSTANPTVEQILQRLLVSHDWQAEVFERFLREQDPDGDFRRMLAATTAIVIGGRVRPAFYWSATGAIYLDASYLWLTPEQRDTISEAPDPRSAFGQDLQYATPWRYVKDNQHATPARPVAERATRPLSEIKVELGRLLYHELAHAGDFFPPRVQANLNGDLRVYQAVAGNTPSQQLQQQIPFFSQEMVGLGRVNFFGEASTATQRAYRPEDIVVFFSNDRVNDDYSYSLPSSQTVPREDLAMLVEEALVQLRYGVLRDFGITPRPPEGTSSADQVLTWGQRGRIGDAALRPRLRLVLADLMPWLPASELDRLAPPLQLRSGLTWGQNLDQAAVAQNRPRALKAPERAREAELAEQQRFR